MKNNQASIVGTMFSNVVKTLKLNLNQMTFITLMIVSLVVNTGCVSRQAVAYNPQPQPAVYERRSIGEGEILDDVHSGASAIEQFTIVINVGGTQAPSPEMKAAIAQLKVRLGDAVMRGQMSKSQAVETARQELIGRYGIMRVEVQFLPFRQR